MVEAEGRDVDGQRFCATVPRVARARQDRQPQPFAEDGGHPGGDVVRVQLVPRGNGRGVAAVVGRGHGQETVQGRGGGGGRGGVVVGRRDLFRKNEKIFQSVYTYFKWDKSIGWMTNRTLT